MAKRAKFKVGQVAVICGYLENDPRAFGIVKSVSRDGLTFVLYLEISGGIDTITYSVGELRPLTTREVGPNWVRRKECGGKKP